MSSVQANQKAGRGVFFMCPLGGTHQVRDARHETLTENPRKLALAKCAIALIHHFFPLPGARPLRRLFALLMIGAATAPGRVLAAEAKAWRQPASVTWNGAALRESLGRFAESQSVCVILDRRIDPGVKLELAADHVPAEAIIRAAGEQAAAHASLIGPVAYLGPEATAKRLATVAALRTQDAQRLPTALREKVLERRSWAWPDFATPRELLAELAAEADLKLEGAEQIPHDLWAGAKLPKLTLVERLTLVLAQFDLTYRITDDDASVNLVPMPASVSIERDYAAGNDPRQRAHVWRERAPEAEIEIRGTRIIVRGTIEEHQALTAANKPTARPDEPATGTQVYTLTVSGKPLGVVLPQLAKQLHLKLDLDETVIQDRAGSLDKLVELQVKEATLKELLDELLKDSELAYRVEDETLYVFPGESVGRQGD